ncbi:unnamed protein product [Parnassius apollo]|uniref:(apollo) hypothetical protein n=1 Tax=Parnassius apollo TaxID=110799 RepID=A0A8S3X8W5_PARAO|nr:unnamed protein product [Parnassius apollo]
MTTLGASGKNDVENYKNLTRMRSVKKPRFISLGGITDSINVGLDFSVPFLKIPLNKNTHSGFGLNHLGAPILTFDPTSLAFGGILVLVTSFLASAFTKDFAPMQNHRRYGRRT